MCPATPQFDREIAAVQKWFETRGFFLVVREADGIYWADLISLATREVLAARYGRGTSPGGAAGRAKTRFAEEE